MGGSYDGSPNSESRITDDLSVRGVISSYSSGDAAHERYKGSNDSVILLVRLGSAPVLALRRVQDYP